MELGTVHDTTDCVFAFEVADTAVGATGGPFGITAADAVDAAPVPAEFVAVTVNVYEVPFVSPETVHEVVADAQVNAPGDEVTVYVVIAAPPFEAGAVHDTTDVPVAFAEVTVVADTAVGATGGPTGVTATFDQIDERPVPAEFVAITENW